MASVGARLVSLRPSYIELAQCTICLPAHLTKNARKHLFPIGALAVELCSTIQVHAKGFELIFPARGNANAPFCGWSKSKSKLDELCGVKEWTLHDIRRTIHGKIGTAPDIAERLDNHARAQREFEKL